MIIGGSALFANGEQPCMRKKCKCGRFEVRRVYYGEVIRYKIPTKIKVSTGTSNYRKSRPHSDGLCERCAKYGLPEYQESSTLGIPVRESYSNSDERKSKIAINNVKFEVR